MKDMNFHKMAICLMFVFGIGFWSLLGSEESRSENADGAPVIVGDKKKGWKIKLESGLSIEIPNPNRKQQAIWVRDQRGEELGYLNFQFEDTQTTIQAILNFRHVDGSKFAHQIMNKDFADPDDFDEYLKRVLK